MLCDLWNSHTICDYSPPPAAATIASKTFWKNSYVVENPRPSAFFGNFILWAQLNSELKKIISSCWWVTRTRSRPGRWRRDYFNWQWKTTRIRFRKLDKSDIETTRPISATHLRYFSSSISSGYGFTEITISIRHPRTGERSFYRVPIIKIISKLQIGHNEKLGFEFEETYDSQECIL